MHLLQRVFCVASAARCRLYSYFGCVIHSSAPITMRELRSSRCAVQTPCLYTLCSRCAVPTVYLFSLYILYFACRHYLYSLLCLYTTMRLLHCVFCVASAARCKLCSYFSLYILYAADTIFIRCYVYILSAPAARCNVFFLLCFTLYSARCKLCTISHYILCTLRSFRCAVQII